MYLHEMSVFNFDDILTSLNDAQPGAFAELWWNAEVWSNVSMCRRRDKWEVFCWSNVKLVTDYEDVLVYTDRTSALAQYRATRDTLIKHGAHLTAERN